MRAVWPEPSPAVLRLTFAAGISEVSRFSRMKFLIWSELSIPFLFIRAVDFDVGLHGLFAFRR
jgi:hypothetical protein